MLDIKRDYWPTDEWRKCTPEEVGMKREILYSVHREITTQLKRVNSFLVIRNGHIVFENYYNGYDENKLNIINSVTKSFISALIGVAIYNKHIEGVQQKLCDLLPCYVNNCFDSLKQEITLKHLLAMTSGIYWGKNNMGDEMLDKLCASTNWTEYMLSLPIDIDKLDSFQYNSGVSHLLSAIITKATKMSAQQYANKYLFEQIGVNPITDDTLEQMEYNLRRVPWNQQLQWAKDPQGINTGGFGLCMRPRDMAKLGYLYLNNGKWEEKNIFSEEWVCDSLKIYSKPNKQMGYGYHWWIRECDGYTVYYAAGFGGQYIQVVPQYDLVVVATCGEEKKNLSLRDPGRLLDKYVIPSIREK